MRIFSAKLTRKQLIIIILAFCTLSVVLSIAASSWLRAWLAVNAFFYLSYFLLACFPAFSAAKFLQWYPRYRFILPLLLNFLCALHFLVFAQPDMWLIVSAFYRGEYFLIPFFEFLQALPAWFGIMLLLHHGAGFILDKVENRALLEQRNQTEFDILLRISLYLGVQVIYLPIIKMLLERAFQRL